jgi:predicted RNA-binding protein associated with RNAse of E/G family
MWSLWVFWGEGMESVRAWYINIDSAYERTRFGFDTWDMFLDVVVEADRKSWRYKDEEEFADAIKAGLFTEREAEEVRATAAQALEIIKSNHPPFDNVWEKWRPDLLWEMPQLPDDWEHV